jgi:hypothetical protein
VWVIFLVIAVLWPVLMLGMCWLRGQEISPEVVAIYAVFGLPVAGPHLAEPLDQARERRKPSGSPAVTNINEAMSTGRLPEHASADQWVPELSRIIRQEQWWAWVGAALLGLSAAMGVFLVFDKPEHPWLGPLAVAGGLGLAVWYPIWVPRRRARIEALIAQFPEETAEIRAA